MRYWNNSNARCKLISAQVTDQDQRSSRAKTGYKNTQGLLQNSSEAPANYSTERTPDGCCHHNPGLGRQRLAQGLGQRTPVCAQRSHQQRLCRRAAQAQPGGAAGAPGNPARLSRVSAHPCARCWERAARHGESCRSPCQRSGGFRHLDRD